MAKRQKTTYHTQQILQLAIYVDKAQGFVKSGNGYYDQEKSEMVYDNKTAILNYVIGETPMPEIGNDIIEQVEEIVESFKLELIGKKMSGRINDFETNVLQSISNETVEAFGVAVLASLPNSFRVQFKRQTLDDWFDAHRKTSEFVGVIGERIKLAVHIKDVKFISKYGIHLVTCVDTNQNILKFFFNKEPDISGIIEGKDAMLTGKIKTHDISKFSNCKETVFNYVRIEH
jgi:hypothetical protein|tara:strand:- start:8916 stop:9608 length:693 start_codon:yes stop_codon:yes gene_type:complete